MQRRLHRKSAWRLAKKLKNTQEQLALVQVSERRPTRSARASTPLSLRSCCAQHRVDAAAR